MKGSIGTKMFTFRPSRKKNHVKNPIEGWMANQLQKSTPKRRRFRIAGIKQSRPQAILVDFGKKGTHWIPTKSCEIGVDPSGFFFAIDLDEWVAKTKGLLYQAMKKQ